MDNEPEELKPCPFDGGRARLHDLTGQGYPPYYVSCVNCRVQQGAYKSKTEAISFWNARYKSEEADSWLEERRKLDAPNISVMKSGETG